MNQSRQVDGLRHRQEKQLLKAVAAAIETEFPNPMRSGCPEPATVRRLAQRRIALSETANLVDHIATCAPCFDAYTRARRRSRLVKVGAPLLSAVVLFALAIWFSHRTSPGPSTHQLIADLPPVSVTRATLDYRETSFVRSGESQTISEQPPHVPRAVLDLTVLLPLGTEDGEYSVELRSGETRPMLHATGTAVWDGHAVALTTRVDLRRLVAGPYTLALRKSDSSWRTYRLTLEEPK